ncbi:UbiD family decarboxylase [Stappia sp.]|uniref:UbiD family decarboxylase n=1 Tax=Stappia sp. TaxID=1870903 RepID=UPI003C7CB7B9
MAQAGDNGHAVEGPTDRQRFDVAYSDLRDWIAEAEALGELEVLTGVDWQEGIGAATELVSHSDSTPALMFDEIPGHAKGFRVLTNIFGGKRKAMTLGFPAHYDKQALSNGFSEIYRPNDALIPPTIVDTGPILDTVLEGDAIDLDIFPTPLWHPGDGGRYIGTGSFNLTRDPDSGWLNLGCYRVMLNDRQSLSYNAGPGKHGRLHHQKYAARGEHMPVAIVVGGDPLTFLLSGIEAPAEISEYDIAGGMRGRPLELVRGRHTGLPFPANAEIVIEGFVDPEAVVPEGPFGDWTGTYTEAGRKRPLVRVSAIYHRSDPILLGFIPQSLPDEYSRFRAITRTAIVRRNIEASGIPGIAGVWCHEVGGARMLTVVAIEQRHPGHARQAGHIACQCHAGAYGGKWVIVVDDDIDPSNLDEVIWAALTRSDPATSTDFIRGAWTSPADPRIPPEQRAAGDITNSRMIIDACIPFHWRDQFPASSRPTPEQRAAAKARFGHLLR